jgi:Spy/CpxP family protein refolding chaperone
LLSLLVIVAPSAFAEMKHDPMKQCQNCDMHKSEMGGMMSIGGADHMGEMMGMCLDNAEKIGLSPDQIKKITPIHREMQKKQVRFKADLKIAEMEQKEIMEVKDFDLEKASAAVKKMTDIKTAHQLDMLKSMKEVRTIFTEDQFKKMKQLMPMKMGGETPGKKNKHKH